MADGNTPTLKKQQARRLAEEIPQPAGMSRTTWSGVQTVLRAIADSYPKAWPSQRTLAERLDMNERTLRRYIAAAVKAQILVVEADAGALPRRVMGSRTNRYWLKLSSWHEDKLSFEYNTYSVGVSETSSQRTSSSVPQSARPPASRHSRPKGTVVNMREWQEDHGRQVGPEPKPSLRPAKRAPRQKPDEIVGALDSGKRVKKRPKAPPPESRQLAEYFAVIWEQMQQTHGLHKDTRGLESYGQAKTYIEAHFKNRTGLEIRQMMNEFVTGVSNGTITLKPKQSGWMCFTGAWGRTSQGVAAAEDDVYAELRQRRAEGKGG